MASNTELLPELRVELQRANLIVMARRMKEALPVAEAESDDSRRSGSVWQEGSQSGRFESLFNYLHHLSAVTSELVDKGTAGHQGASATHRSPTDLPADAPRSLGRYELKRLLGQGGFGRVYLAYDTRLKREVAIKVPHPTRAARPRDTEAYLNEARHVAQLDHPHIVPVYDADQTDEGWCYVVSKYVSGGDLASMIKEEPLQAEDAVELIATIARALDHAHQRGIIHRDIKPANILVDDEGCPFLSDFGLAQRDTDATLLGQGGTPAYMSPEQARGEGHRVGPRSDVFSLGVVLYELLAGQRPFASASLARLRQMIESEDPPPLQSICPNLDAALEHIASRALSKRISDRHASAMELANELQAYLEQKRQGLPLHADRSPNGQAAFPLPKGLRPLETSDVSDFLPMLPGPRDARGIPQSVQFWKTRIEADASREPFRVGLLYGPSGSGKSSFVRSGLLPILSDRIVPIYLEAHRSKTEENLRRALERAVPSLPQELSLSELVTRVRRGEGLPDGNKLLIIIDQLEQWLHGNPQPSETELVKSLRQCDGERVQTLLLVRDDFWSATSRLMQAIEVPIVDGTNSALLEPFDEKHVRRLVAGWYQAIDARDQSTANATAPSGSDTEPAVEEQGESPDKSADELADAVVDLLLTEGSLTRAPLHLAMLVSLLGHERWTVERVRQFPNVTAMQQGFLRRWFDQDNAPLEIRTHARAIRAVLQQLAGDSSSLKAEPVARERLQVASGYEHSSAAFEEVLEILDQRTRLVHAIDESEATDEHAARGSTVFYQLSHDGLVEMVRQWLAEERRATRSGRAQLLLEERTESWMHERRSAHLPSLLETIQIRVWTSARRWNDAQRSFMRAATRHHVARWSVGAIAAMMLLTAWFLYDRQIRAQFLVQSLVKADATSVPGILQQLAAMHRWSVTPLRQASRRQWPSEDAPLHLQLALAPDDDQALTSAIEGLVTVDGERFSHLVNVLPSGPLADATLQKILDDQQRPSSVRLRAVVLWFAGHQAIPTDVASSGQETWQENWIADALIDEILREPLLARFWMEQLRPLAGQLVGPLEKRFLTSSDDPLVTTQRAEDAGERRLIAARLLVDYAGNDPQRLWTWVRHAEAREVPHFLMALRRITRDGKGKDWLEDRAVEDPWREVETTGSWSVKERVALFGQEARGAMVLAMLDQPDRLRRWLARAEEPTAQTEVMIRIREWRFPLTWWSEQIKTAKDAALLRAILLALGEYEDSDLPPELRSSLEEQVQRLVSHPDSGTHSAAIWLLARWGIPLAAPSQEHAAPFAEENTNVTRKWHRNRLGMTMVEITGPTEFVMGSPQQEEGRTQYEALHTRQIPRSFAIATHEVTESLWSEFLSHDSGSQNVVSSENVVVTDGASAPSSAESGDKPAIFMNWYQAVAFCNWLSEREGISNDQWCYEPNAEGQYAEGMRPASNFLDRVGYRLPTEGEWETACRAGSRAARWSGDNELTLTRFVWYRDNSGRVAKPVGTMAPNAWGLFDTLGNAFEWCHEAQYRYPRAGATMVDESDRSEVKDDDWRILRGGSFQSLPEMVRCAYRYTANPTENSAYGLRPARTLR